MPTAPIAEPGDQENASWRKDNELPAGTYARFTAGRRDAGEWDECRWCGYALIYPATCILTGADGENDDDCTTHEHTYQHGRISPRADVDYTAEIIAEIEACELAKTPEPAKWQGPTFGPFTWFELTYTDLRMGESAEPKCESETLAYWDAARGDWVLTEFAGDLAGESYSDITIFTNCAKEPA